MFSIVSYHLIQRSSFEVCTKTHVKHLKSYYHLTPSTVNGCLPPSPVMVMVTKFNMKSELSEPCRITSCFLTVTVVCCAILHTPTHLQNFTPISRLSVFSSSSANWSTNGVPISTANQSRISCGHCGNLRRITTYNKTLSSLEPSSSR